MTDEEQMLEEYKAEMERHQQAIRDIMRKYNPDYDAEYDRQQRGDKMMCEYIDKLYRDFEEEKK